MKKSDFYYDLPQELIAQRPANRRDESSLLFFDSNKNYIKHNKFYEIKNFFKKGDLLVLNNSKVIPARLMGHKEGMSKAIEILLLKRLEDDDFACLIKPAKRAKVGTRIDFTDNDSFYAIVIDELSDGQRKVRFYYSGIWQERLEELGTMPLPPYIKEKLLDQNRYQTVYAKEDGSAAAPTAGLHFTEKLLSELKDFGVEIAYVTLHVGLGTFRPLKNENIDEHIMHSEYYEIDSEVANRINQAKAEGRRVIAVGTTTCRVLETVANEEGEVKPSFDETNIFIKPPYRFKVLDGLITNFHLPESTLLMLVSAFIGYDNTLSLYKRAVELKYRFFSFGDAMFLLKSNNIDEDIDINNFIEKSFNEDFSDEFIQDKKN